MRILTKFFDSRRSYSLCRRTPACLIALLLTSNVAPAADWPPAFDSRNPTIRSHDGRRIERYTHGPRKEWGYANISPAEWRYSAAQESGKLGQNHDSFYVVSPRKRRQRAPLCVVLHSANRTAFDYLGFQFLGRKVDPTDEPADVVTRVPDDCYALFLSSTNEEWWGWITARDDSVRYAKTLTPAEKRILDTISWVIARYKIDRNRVYLSGVSMGGSGALSIGLTHGDIFAAVLTDVPAGSEFAALRLGSPRLASGPLPDPPVTVDLFAVNHKWSESQPLLMQAVRAGRLPLVAAWGPFGHTAFRTPIGRYGYDEAALAFPWLEIRKNAAYPVFTDASSNQNPPPMASPADFDQSGQINAYFRWKTVQDTERRFAMKLWLAHPVVANPASMPDESTADITLRRLQSFQVLPGQSYAWQLVRDGRRIASGSVAPDAANLLTIPRVKLTIHPAELSLETESR
jgi:pimeloyl-ACP methyl ester carboxylesterase